MSFPVPNVLLTEVPSLLYRKLVILLSENEAWEKVAVAFTIFTEFDIHVLRQHKVPAEKLLGELSMRLCNVEMLCQVLEGCELYNALMLFKNHEQIHITEHPFGTGDGNTCMVERERELRLTCRAVGLPPPTYQWYRGNEELAGQTQPLLCISRFNLRDEGEYYCVVNQEGYDSEASNIVTVNIAPEPPVFIKQPSAQEVCRLGTNLTLTVEVHGHPKPMYQWFKENRQLDGQTQPQLQILIRSELDDGSYSCYVKNKSGEAQSRPCKVTVYASPEDADDPRLTPSAKMALLIANQNYVEMKPLNTPENDAKTIADLLRQLGFHVLALQNLTLTEMRNAVVRFSEYVPQDAYVVFYFAGHGFELNAKFMLPVDAPGLESFLQSDALCERELLKIIMSKKPKMLLELLDMCLKTPDPLNKKIRNEKQPMIDFEADSPVIQAYSTTSTLGAYERKADMNGLYVKYLKQYLTKDDSVVSILNNVARDIERENANGKAPCKQVPYYGTNMTKKVSLTDPCHPDLKIQDQIGKQLETLWQVPEPCKLIFKQVPTEALVTCQPHRHVFSNTLQLHVTGLDRFRLVCEAVDEQLELRIERSFEGLTVVVGNIQRLRTPKTLTFCLHSRQSTKHTTDEEVLDLAEWELGKPMIAVADLWWAPGKKEGDEIKEENDEQLAEACAKL